MTESIFCGHLNDLLGNYRKILMINLVKKNKIDEEKLMRGLVQMLKLVKTNAEKEVQENKEDKISSDNVYSGLR